MEIKLSDYTEEVVKEKIKEYSYTWKEEYGLPYESQWGRIAKFCFLNGLPWNHIINNTKLKNAICDDIPRWPYVSIPIAKNPNIKQLAGKRILDVNKMCPECMKYGFHSSLHETEGMNHCFIHNCQLIRIPTDKFYQSAQGTYDFFDVKTENIIRNEEIANKLLAYKKKLATSNIISNHFISFAYNRTNNSIRFYESTERLYQRLVLLQDNIELYGCKQLILLNSNDINDEKRRIIENGVHTHLKNIKELKCMSCVLYEMSYNDAVNFCIDICYKRKEGGKYAFERDMLGLCFINALSKLIRIFFKDLHEWEDFATLACKESESLDYTYLNFESRIESEYEYICKYEKWKYITFHNTKEDIYKLAIIIVYYAITDSFSTYTLTEENSNRWGEQYFHLDFSLPINRIMNEPEYVIYPIIEDLLQNLINQACYMIETGIIKPGYENLIELNQSIWKVPQYIIINYNERIEVYRCDAD